MREPTMPAMTMVSPTRPAFTSSPWRSGDNVLRFASAQIHRLSFFSLPSLCKDKKYAKASYRVVFDDHAVQQGADGIKRAHVQACKTTNREKLRTNHKKVAARAPWHETDPQGFTAASFFFSSFFLFLREAKKQRGMKAGPLWWCCQDHLAGSCGCQSL